MRNYPAEDLFESTKMTFGEHIEDLRSSLFRAVLGLVVGFMLGMLVGKYVVRWIQTPLVDALETHYTIKAEEDLVALYGEKVPQALRDFVKTSRVIYEDVYVERSEWERLNRLAGVGAESGSEPLALPNLATPLGAPDANLIKTRIWRRMSAKLTTLNAQEGFMIWMKASFISGLLIASPYMFIQIWNFVAAGLYPHERRFVYLYLPISLILFWAGAALAFFFTLDYVLDFFLSFNRAMDIQAEPRISEWMSFVLLMPLAFGIAFQLPLVMLFLYRIGIFSIQAYLEKWRIAVLVIFVLAMVLTPSADPVSMLLMAFPLVALYFLGIGLCKWLPRSKNPHYEGYDPVA